MTNPVTTSKVIHGLDCKVTQKSKYPLPWTGNKADRPKDYFEQIETTIQYMENEQEIKIIIPAVKKGQNRNRKLKLVINGIENPLNRAGLSILDMDNTFDLPEIDKLLALVAVWAEPKPEDPVLRTVLPFFYIPAANYTLPAHKAQLLEPYFQQKKSKGRPAPSLHALEETHGNIERLVLPYIEAMNAYPNKRKEFYIPVVTMGEPHHWNVCVLTIDEQNVPHVTYLETTATPKDHMHEAYLEFYKKDILPGINKALSKNNYSSIPEHAIVFDAAKQFSEEGCGITASLNIQSLLAGTLEIAHLDNPSFSANRYISIEEDALRRVQLAMKLTKHDEIISKWKSFSPEQQQLSDQARYQLEIVLRELKTHPYVLKQRARERFTDSKKKSASTAVPAPMPKPVPMSEPAHRPKPARMPASEPMSEPARMPASEPMSEPVAVPMPESDFDLDLINKYNNKFNRLLEKLEDIQIELTEKEEKSTNYHEILLSVIHLNEVLQKELGAFFKNPRADIYQACQQKCQEAIEETMNEAAKHRGWHRLNSILKGFLGVLAGLTLIPALAVELGTKKGYIQTFFFKPATETLKRMEDFNTHYEQDKKPLDEQTRDHRKKNFD